MDRGERVCEKPLKQTPRRGSCNVQAYSQKLVFWHHGCVTVLDSRDTNGRCDCVLDVGTAVQKDHCTNTRLPRRMRSGAEETQAAVLLAR